MKPGRYAAFHMTRLVNLDYAQEAKQEGDTIDVPIPSEQTVAAIVAGAAQTEPNNNALGKVQIQLNQHFGTSFGITDLDASKIQSNKDFLPMQLSEAFQAMAAKINQTVFAEYKGVYGYVGTAATIPFGSGVEIVSATDLRKVLNQQKAPRANRRGMLDWDAEAQALGLAAFSDAEKIGSSDVKISGEIGRKLGFDWFADDDVPTHTAGTLGGTGSDTIIKASTAHAVGVESLTTTVGATNAMALLEGDIITIAGDTQTYVVTADAAGAATTDVVVAISPPLKVALVGSEVLSIKATHVANDVIFYYPSASIL